jgi:hypothetical protein
LVGEGELAMNVCTWSVNLVSWQARCNLNRLGQNGSAHPCLILPIANKQSAMSTMIADLANSFVEQLRALFRKAHVIVNEEHTHLTITSFPPISAIHGMRVSVVFKVGGKKKPTMVWYNGNITSVENQSIEIKFDDGQAEVFTFKELAEAVDQGEFRLVHEPDMVESSGESSGESE